MPITPLPEPPSRADAANFAQRGDAFMAALPTYVAEFNALQVDVTNKQETASTAATTATTKAGEASDDAAAALASKNAAATSESNADDSAFAAAQSEGAALASKNAAATSEANAAASAASVDPQNLATDYAGPTPPATTWPFMTWADTGNMLLKRRNAADTDWVVEDYLLMSLSDRAWANLPVGARVPIWDHIAGMPVPPSNNPHFRYVKLTAGDAYNTGALSSESVIGSYPNITATAVISLAGSPINGATIHLLNTSRNFERPGQSGISEGFMTENHNHRVNNINGSDANPVRLNVTTGTGNITGMFFGGTTLEMFTSTPFFGGRGGVETRPNSMGATVYMRAK